MGQEVSLLREKIRDVVGNDNEKKKMEEHLQILEKMVTSRLEIQQTQMLAGTRGDQEIHIGTVVQEYKQVNIMLKESPTDALTRKEEGEDEDDRKSEKPPENTMDSINAFFSSRFMQKLGKLVYIAVSTILGNSCIGEHETNQMFIVWTDALLRYDMYCYRWNFASEGVIENTEGVTGVLLIKWVIDFTKTDAQVLTWAISRQARTLGREHEIEEMVTEAMKILEKVVKFQRNVRKVEQAEEAIEFVQWTSKSLACQVDFYSASIALSCVVEFFLSELVL